jgi:hypothetical protein
MQRAGWVHNTPVQGEVIDPLLSLELRHRTVIEQFNEPRFLQAVNDLRPMRAPERLTESLHGLIASR